MRKPIFLRNMLLACVFVAAVFANGAAADVLAAPAHSAQPEFTNPHITTKNILSDTSIDGPSFWESHGVPMSAVAWTGTDAAHHVNVRTTRFGEALDFAAGLKRILPETSFVGPAVVINIVDNQPTVSVAWTGTDSQHTLNVRYDVFGNAPKKLTLAGQTSFTSPSLSLAPNGTMFLAWAGTDSSHKINVIPITVSGTNLTAGNKTTLANFHSAARPSLVADGTSSGHFLLSWSVPGTHQIAFATSSDGTTFTMPSTSPLSDTTASGPSLIGVGVPNFPDHFLAWAGTDALHSLNVQFTQNFPSWGNAATTKTTFKEFCFGGPALDYGIAAVHPTVAWTGIDRAHHINVATVDV